MSKKHKNNDEIVYGNTTISDTQEEPKELPITEAKKEEPMVENPVDVVNLRVFATLCSAKWDQIAGFINYARRMKFGPMSVKAWYEELTKFQNKPV